MLLTTEQTLNSRNGVFKARLQQPARAASVPDFFLYLLVPTPQNLRVQDSELFQDSRAQQYPRCKFIEITNVHTDLLWAGSCPHRLGILCHLRRASLSPSPSPPPITIIAF